ncbi:MAG: hypothetical protein N2111_09330 [Candidatus Sumerlaeaceae bacterium]|nr:hypothetical protein [Candidatus Sumerlaeaceae bacterium]
MMIRNGLVGLVAIGLIGMCAVGFSQAAAPAGTPAPARTPAPTPRRDRSVGITDPNNYSRERLSRSTPTPRPTAKPQTQAGAGATTAPAGRREARPAGGKPAGGGAAAAPAVTGHVKEVTKGMIEAIRTRKVEYNEEELADEPGVVILNPRKLQPSGPAILRGGSGGAAEDLGVPAKPL